MGPAESNGRFATAHQRSTTSNTDKNITWTPLKLCFNKASLRVGNKLRKCCLFLPLLKLGKERQMQKRVFSHPRVQKDIPHVALGAHLHCLTAIAWGALPSTSTMVYHSKQQALLVNLTQICQLINSFPHRGKIKWGRESQIWIFLSKSSKKNTSSRHFQYCLKAQVGAGTRGRQKNHKPGLL